MALHTITKYMVLDLKKMSHEKDYCYKCMEVPKTLLLSQVSTVSSLGQEH